jgi:5-methylcytosine-specific restriction endonuclease McrA
MVCCVVSIPGNSILALRALEKPRNRRKIAKTVRDAVYVRDQFRCQLCFELVEPDGPHARQPSLDHIKRCREDGRGQVENLRLVHKGCNEERERLAILEEWGIFPSWFTTRKAFT